MARQFTPKTPLRNLSHNQRLLVKGLRESGLESVDVEGYVTKSILENYNEDFYYEKQYRERTERKRKEQEAYDEELRRQFYEEQDEEYNDDIIEEKGQRAYEEILDIIDTLNGGNPKEQELYSFLSYEIEYMKNAMGDEFFKRLGEINDEGVNIIQSIVEVGYLGTKAKSYWTSFIDYIQAAEYERTTSLEDNIKINNLSYDLPTSDEVGDIDARYNL